MNTGTSKGPGRAAVLLMAAVSLSACNGAGGVLNFASSERATEGVRSGPVIPNSPSVKLARGAVTIKAPKGYCVDDTSVTSGLTGSSATLAKCSALNGKGAEAERSAVMTVSVSPRRPAPATAPSADDLAAAVAPAAVLDKTQKGALALVHVATGGNEQFKPADPRYWRGATSLESRLILLGLYAPVGAPLAGEKGGELLTQLARRISVTRGSLLGFANRAIPAKDSQDASAPANDTTQTLPDQPAAPETSEKKGLGRVFGRLFNRS